jgi:hypothetical protein
MAAAVSKSSIVKLDRRGEHRDDVADVRTPPPEGKFVFVPASQTAIINRSRGQNDDNDIYYQDAPPKSITTNLFRRGKGRAIGIDLPPSLSLVPTLSHRYRFQSTSNALTLCSTGNFLGSLGVIGTVTNSTVATIASSFRLNRIEVWPASGGTCTVDWASATGYTKDEMKDASLPSGVTVTKSLRFLPPKQSFAALWTNEVNSSVALFSMFAPTGSIIDVHVSYTICGVFAPLNISVATAVIGSSYYLALDGPSTNHYPPVGLPTTH